MRRGCPMRCRSSATRRCFRRRSAPIFRPGESRAGWMLNVTDDAWFGMTPGPYQHFAQSAPAGGRTRPAPGARRQFRHLSGRRWPWPHRRRASARRRRRARQRAAGAGAADFLFQIRRRYADLAMDVLVVPRRSCQAEAPNVIRILLRIRRAGLAGRGVCSRASSMARARSPTAICPIRRWGSTAYWALPNKFPLLQPFIERQINPLLWDPVLLNILKLPTWLVLGLIGAWLSIRHAQTAAADRTFQPFALMRIGEVGRGAKNAQADASSP